MRMAKHINSVVFILAVLSSANSETSNTDRNKAAKQPCFSPNVKEGDTGKVTFFIRHDLISSTDFSATIRRASNPVKDILVCTQGQPMKCEVNSPDYLSFGSANHSITLLIPSVTKDFADTYLLQMYASGSFQQPFVCPLVVEACDEGWYGPSCNRSCGSCLDDAPCNKESGKCTACKPGWTLPFCLKACGDGWYGPSCISRCGSCHDNQTCDKNTGHCTKCQPGWTPPFCQTAPKIPCRSLAVTEGLIGKLKYYIRPDVLSSDDFYATIRRTRHPDNDVLVCTRRSPIQCNVNDQRYRSTGIRGHILILQIPNVTREFDDRYVFQVYANGSFQHPDVCQLRVTAYKRPCIAPLVSAGQTGRLEYYIRPDIQSTDDFFATIRRGKNPDKDILVCARKSPIQCTVNDQRYLSTGIKADKLTLEIPNITAHFQDTYTLQVYANGSFQNPDNCPLMVRACDDGRYGEACQFQCGRCDGDQPCHKESGHCEACKPGWTLPSCETAGLRDAEIDVKDSSYTTVIAVIVSPLLLVVITIFSVGVFCYFRRKRNKKKDHVTFSDELHNSMNHLKEEQENQEKNSEELLKRIGAYNETQQSNKTSPEESTARLLPSNDNAASPHDEIENKPWYFGNISREEGERLLMLPHNKNRSFLIRLSEMDSGCCVLSVRKDDDVKHLLIHQKTDRSGLYLEGARCTFPTLPELVQHYSEKNIISEPCQREELP